MTKNSSEEQKNSQPRGLLYGIAAMVVIGLGVSLYVLKQGKPPSDMSMSETATGEATTAEVETVAAAAPDAGAPAAGAPELKTDEAGLSKAVVTIETPKGKIKFRFYTQDAPNTTARIVELIKSGFYNGLNFHRVEPGFVIQGGDPNGNGTGGSGKKLGAEFNTRKHLLGTVAMARAQDPNSADSQFYIALGPIPQLDGSYTVFGQVSEGIEVVQKIAVGDKMTKVSVE